MTPNQIFMLKMFEKGWGFKLYNERPVSWVTYWSLRRRGLLSAGPTKTRTDGNLIAECRLTKKGREVLRKLKEKNT